MFQVIIAIEEFFLGFQEIVNVEVIFTMPQFSVRAYSFEGDFPIMLYLNITTFKHLNPQLSNWSRAELGYNFLFCK